VAIQHGLKYVTLDDHINLGNYQFDDFYKQASVKVTGKKPGEWITRTGQSVTYGITLIKGAPNPSGAVRFLEYLLSADGGLKVLKEMGQPPFIPCRVTTQAIRGSLPGNLPDLVEVSE
jgi:molybdate/tungstate transport system substrate-binding protein